jgi:DNA repair exonuclease SbcCD nuclease subunit
MSDTQAAFLGDQSLVVDTRALAAIGFDAVLAGHFHKHQVLSTHPLVAYAGSPYRTDFGEEHQTKGYLIVDVDETVSMEFVETPARRFVTLHSLDALVDTPIEGAVVRFLDADDDPTVIRANLESYGPFDVQEIRRRPAVPSAAAGGLSEGLTVEQALEEYFAGDDDRDALIARGRQILEAVG